MFSCCDLCYEKYLKDEPGHPVSKELLDKVNEKALADRRIDEPKQPDNVCRCACHVVGLNVKH